MEKARGKCGATRREGTKARRRKATKRRRHGGTKAGRHEGREAGRQGGTEARRGGFGVCCCFRAVPCGEPAMSQRSRAVAHRQCHSPTVRRRVARFSRKRFDAARKRAGIVVAEASEAGLAPRSGQPGLIHAGTRDACLDGVGRLDRITDRGSIDGKSHLRTHCLGPKRLAPFTANAPSRRVEDYSCLGSRE